MKEATAYERDIAQEENDDALAKIKAAGTTTVYALTPKQREAWRQALLPVHKEFQDVVGKDNIDAINQLAAKSGKGAPKK